MPNYRRLHIEGGTYFFTVVTARRAPVFAAPEARLLLRTAIQKVRRRHPFEIIAMVVLPDHLHAIWRLPEGDSDYPLRWRLIKTHVTRHTDGGKRLWQALLGTRHSGRARSFPAHRLHTLESAQTRPCR